MSDEHEDTGAIPVSTFPDAGVVTIGKKDYAAGLIWTRVDDPKTISSTARKSAAADGADLFLIRKSGNQFGLGSTEAGHKAGMPSLADTLSKGVEGSAWTGIFLIGEETYYFVAVQTGLILAAQDRIIHGRENALEIFSGIFLRGEWEHAFAPADFNLSRNTEDRSLEDVLGDTRPGPSLKPLSNKGLLLKAAAALFVLGVLFFGYQAYQSYQESVNAANLKTQLEEAAERKRQADLLKSRTPQAVVEIPLPPFTNKPSYSATLTACVNAMKNAPTQIPGWKPAFITCFGSGSADEGTVALSFTRDGGTINWIAPFVDSKIYHISTTGTNGNISGIEIRWNVPGYANLAHYSDKTPTLPLGEVRKHLVSNAEENFMSFRIADLPPQLVEIAVAGNNQPQQVPVSKGLSFITQVRHDPVELLQIISPLPVAVMNKVSLDMTGWNWIIEGSAYETVPLPPDAKPYQRPATPGTPVRPAGR